MTSSELCGTSKPLHPNAPCDERGISVRIERRHNGHVIVSRDAVGCRVYYYGDLDPSDGVVRSMVKGTLAELNGLLNDLAGRE